MPDSLYILGELIQNLGLLAIIVVGQTIVARTPPKRWQRETLTGLLFGGAAIVAHVIRTDDTVAVTCALE